MRRAARRGERERERETNERTNVDNFLFFSSGSNTHFLLLLWKRKFTMRMRISENIDSNKTCDGFQKLCGVKRTNVYIPSGVEREMMASEREVYVWE